MLRSKLLLILLSGALLFASCGDSGTDPDDPNGDEPIEPTASVNNPENNAVLEGEITFSIAGEAENGFNEVRIFVGQEQVETLDNPTMPYEQTITTYNYDNGDYDLRAELDVAEEDTTIEASVSVTLENYLLKLGTSGRISQLQDGNMEGDELLFVAAPDGSILKKIDIMDEQDGTLKILPPEELPESGAPEHFTLTSVSNTPDESGNAELFITTDVGFEPWSQVASYDLSSSGSGEAPDSTEITFDFTSAPDNHEYNFVSSNEDYYGVYFSGASTLSIKFEEHTENVLISSQSMESDADKTPSYYWEQNLENDQTLDLSVENAFTPMTSHPVDWPTDTDFNFGSGYSYYVSVNPTSFDEGSIGSLSFDNEINSGTNTMYVPDTDHLFDVIFTGYRMADDDYIQQLQRQQGESLPDDFSPLDYTVTFEDASMDNMELSVEGSDEPDFVFHQRTSEEGHTWIAVLPSDMTEFVFPNIADSLDQSITSNYSRSSFEPYLMQAGDLQEFDSFEEYFEEYFVISNALWNQYGKIKYRIYDLFQSRLKKQKIAPLEIEEARFDRSVPVFKTDKWGNKYDQFQQLFNE